MRPKGAAPAEDEASPSLVFGVAGRRVMYHLVISNFADSKSFPFFFFPDGKYNEADHASGSLG